MIDLAFTPTSIACIATTCYRLLAIFTLAGAVIWGRSARTKTSDGHALKKRFFTYAILSVLIIGTAYLGGLFFIALVGILAFGSIAELFKITSLEHGRTYRYVTYGLCLLAMVAALLFGSESSAIKHGHTIPLFYLLPMIAVASAACTPVFMQTHKNISGNIFCTVFGAIYVGWFLSHLLLIRCQANGFGLIVFLIMCVALNDTLAYAVGRSFGRTKISPLLSPQKTWEGFWGGTIGTILGAVAFHYTVSSISIFTLAGLALVIIVAAPLGDLVISAIKREFAAKESGALLPGHGGLLDRFDSLLLTTPLFYYLLTVSQ